MSGMVLDEQHVSVIGVIGYEGEDEDHASADVVLIHGCKSGGTALALRFKCTTDINRLLRLTDDKRDPCDNELLDSYVSSLIEYAYHYPLFSFLQDQVFPGERILDEWTFSYGYGTFDSKTFSRYVFGHPSDATVDTGEFGKQLKFNHDSLKAFIELVADRHSIDTSA